MVDLVAAGEIKSAPNQISNTLTRLCAVNTIEHRNRINGYCYKATAFEGEGPIVVFSRLEAKANISRCPTDFPEAYAVYSSADGRAGIVCMITTSSPQPGTSPFLP